MTALVDVQDTIGSGLTAYSIAGMTFAVGDSVLVGISWNHATNAPTSVSMTDESNLTLLGAPQGGGADNGFVQWAILESVTAAGSKTIEVNFSGVTTAGFFVARLSGTAVSGGIVDGSPQGASGSSTTPGGSITTTVDGAAIFCVGNSNGGDISAPGSGYTDIPVGNPSWWAWAQYDLDVGAAGAKSPSLTIAGSGAWCFSAIAIKSVAVQKVRPDADVNDGSWTASTGSDLYAMLDESAANDADYISVNSNSECEIGLAVPADAPLTGGHTFRYRHVGSSAKKLLAKVYDGTTHIQTFTHDPCPSALTESAQSITNAISSYADLRIRFETQNATSPPTLQVTYGAIGTGGSGTTSCAPSYPSGISATTSKLFCVVTGRSNTAATAPTMPAGWTPVLDFEGGTGTWGVDTGTRRVTVFQKDTVDGSESGTVTVSLSGTTANTMRASIVRVEVPAGYGIDVAASTGADTSNGTGYSATGSTNISFQANDLLLIAVAQNIDTGTQSAQSITATGITFGTRTNRASTAVTNGNDHRHIIDTVPVSSGSGTVAPTYAYTISASGSGPTGFLRMRAVEPTEAARVTWAEIEVPAGAAPAAPLGKFRRAQLSPRFGTPLAVLRQRGAPLVTALAGGDATATGVTLTATASLIPGSATGERNETAAGVTLTATASIPRRIAEDFNGITAGEDLNTWDGATWEVFSGEFLGEASGDRIRANNPNDESVARHVDVPFRADQIVRAFVKAGDTTNGCMGVSARLNASGDGYSFLVAENGNWWLGDIRGGQYWDHIANDLGGPLAAAVAAGVWLELRAIGTTISVHANGTQLASVTNALYSAGQPGLHGYSNVATIWLDHWSAQENGYEGAGGGAGGQTLAATASLIPGSASADPVGPGVTLTATASLIPGSASGERNGTAAGTTLTASSSLLTNGAGGGAGGQALLATASLIPGAATGDGTANGVTLTASSSTLVGAAGGGAGGQTYTVTASLIPGGFGGAAGGQTLQATASLIPGAAAGGGSANAPGTTLTATASLIAGAASGEINATAGGATVAASSSLIAGAAGGGAGGATLPATASLVPGAATGDASAAGATVIAIASFLPGAPTVDDTADGAIATATTTLIPGAATGEIHATAPGATIVVLAEFLAGLPSVPVLGSTPGYTARPGNRPRVATGSPETPRVARGRSNIRRAA